MRDLPARGGRALLFGYVIVLLMVLVLAFRTEQTIAAVLGGGQPPRVEAKEETAGARLLGEIQRRYEKLAQALPVLRDPFKDPPASAQARQAAQQAARQADQAGSPQQAEPSGPLFPTVRAIVFDQFNPSVQLTLNNEISGWLHRGDSFHGWSVTQITAQSVRVEKDGASYQLRAY